MIRAVRTPVESRFPRHAKAGGLSVVCGCEPFVSQGTKAWGFFHDAGFGEAALRRAPAEPEPAPS
jgi:shikimate 5-dehydrogenase